GLGPVAPDRGLGTGAQVLGHLQQRVGLDLGLAGGLQLLVLLVARLAARRDAADQQLLRDRALLRRDRFQQGVAVGAARTQALGLRLEVHRRGGRGGTGGRALGGGARAG